MPVPLTKNSTVMNASCGAFILINISEQVLADEESKVPIHKYPGVLPQKVTFIEQRGKSWNVSFKQECMLFLFNS